MNLQTSVVFISHRLKADFEALKTGKTEEQAIYNEINAVIDSLKKDPFSGTKIKRHSWPKLYVKSYGITNLWKHNIPNGWRLIYTTETYKDRIACIIIEWFSHIEYDRRFGY